MEIDTIHLLKNAMFVVFPILHYKLIYAISSSLVLETTEKMKTIIIFRHIMLETEGKYNPHL